jgi:hypothetical protein
VVEVTELSKPPKDIAETEARAAERVEKFLKGRLKRLSEDQTTSIATKLHKFYETWRKQTRPQRERLVRYANLLEGVVEDSNFPFEGASNITLHYAAGMTRTFRATFNKTSYQDEEIFVPIFPPRQEAAPASSPGSAPPGGAAPIEAIASLTANQSPLAPQPAAPEPTSIGMPPPMPMPVASPSSGDLSEADIRKLGSGFNHSFSRMCNGLRTLKEGTVPVVRDGTLIISGRWRRQIERCFDQRTYRDMETFKADYPDAESTGLSDGEYANLLDFFLAHADDEEPELVVSFGYDFVKRDEPEYRVGPWAKFVRYPVSGVQHLADCEFYGYEASCSPEEMRLKGKRGEFYKEAAEKVMAARKGSEMTDAWDKALAFVEGITPAEEPEARPIRYVEGTCLLDLDRDGIPEKYEVCFAPEEKVLLKLSPHRLRKNVDGHVPFRLVGRENRIDGVSLIGDCEDLFTQVDTLTRHRNNVRILTTSPVFLFNSKYKEQLDMGRSENVIRPGLTLWVDDPEKAGRQLPIQDLSTTNDNLDEQNLYTRHIELVFGPTQGLSGQQNVEDKRAPGNKTIALLNQANGRIDDYIDEFSLSLPRLADLHAALLFQYHDGKELKFVNRGQPESFPIEWLALPGLKWGVKRRSVQMTPEFALARLGQLAAFFQAMLPLIMAQNPIGIELWNRQVIASGEPNADKLLLEGNNLAMVQQSLQTAQAQSPENPEAQAKAKGQERFHEVMAEGAAHHLLGTKPAAKGPPGQKSPQKVH